MPGKSGRAVRRWNTLPILFGLLLGEEWAHEAGASTEDDIRTSFSTMAAAAEAGAEPGDGARAWSLESGDVTTGLHPPSRQGAAPPQWPSIEKSLSAAAGAGKKPRGSRPAPIGAGNQEAVQEELASGTGTLGISTPGQGQQQRSQQGTRFKGKDQSSQESQDEDEDEAGDNREGAGLQSVKPGLNSVGAVHLRGSEGETLAASGSQMATAENHPSQADPAHGTAPEIGLAFGQGFMDATRNIGPARDDVVPISQSSRVQATLRGGTKYHAVRLPEKSSSSMYPDGATAKERRQRSKRHRTTRHTAKHRSSGRTSNPKNWLKRGVPGGTFLSRGVEGGASTSVWKKRLANLRHFATGMLAGIALTLVLGIVDNAPVDDTTIDEFVVPAAIVVTAYETERVRSRNSILDDLTNANSRISVSAVDSGQSTASES